MSIIRKYVTKTGEERVKVYDSIGGVPVNEYRRKRDKAFRDRRRATAQTARVSEPNPEPQVLPKVPSKVTKAEAIPIKDVRKMQEYAKVGLSFTKIGALFGLSRYVVHQAVVLR